MSCEKFGEVYKASPKYVDTVFTSWAQGFMSGFNFATLQKQYRDLNASSASDQMIHIMAYCASHPSASFAQAVVELYMMLPLRSE